MAQLIKIDSEIIRCKQRLDEIISSIETKVKNANEKINEAALNLYQGSGETATNPLVEPIKNLSNNCNSVISEMIINLKNVSQFMEEQMQGYNTSQEEAKNSLIRLISLMQSLLNGTATDNTIITDNNDVGVENNNAVGNVSNGIFDNNIDDNENINKEDNINIDNPGETIDNSNQSVDYEIKNPDYQNMQIKEEYKLSEPMSSTYDEYAYNEGAERYVSELIGERMGTVDELNKRMDLIVGSYNYYKEMGYSDEMIAGMLGNMCQESTFNLHDDYGNPAGVGVYQWLPGRAPEALDLNTQLDHSVYEINNRTDMGGQTVWERMQNCTTVEEYAKTFAIYFEGDNSSGGIWVRQKYADAMYYLIKNGFKTE